MAKRIKLIVLAVVEEKRYGDENFSDFITRMREKYADAIDTDDITLKALK